MPVCNRVLYPYPGKFSRKVFPTKIFVLSVMLVGLMSGCVPEVVKYNAEGNEQYADAAYAEALDSYRLAQVSEPDQPEPYYNAANTYNRQGDVAGTSLQTDQALKTSNPDLQTQAWYNLGNAYYDAQQWQQAVEAYKAALRLNPDDLDAKHNLELALRAAQQQEQQQEQEQQQQQQQQNQDSGDQEDTGDSPSPDEASPDAQSTPTQEEGTPQQSEDNTGAQTESQQPMTAEQAQQMLEALLGNSETLQEHLQQYFKAPGSTPKEDW